MLFIVSIVYSQSSIPWISYSNTSSNKYGVYHFRKSYDFDKVPTKLIINISADNRYNLFVNGTRVCYGPAKGDLKTYKYDVVDIAPYLVSGNNQLAVLVYNGGKDRPLAFLTAQTAFFLQSEDELYNIKTDETWRVLKNNSYQVIGYDKLLNPAWFYGFYACGGGDDVKSSKFPWNWEKPNYDDSKWPFAKLLKFKESVPWNLYARVIPFMDSKIEKPIKIRKTINTNGTDRFLNGESKITVPKNTKAIILFDFENITIGYPELRVEKGKNSIIKIKYAEALYDTINLKAHRDSVEGKKMYGVWDFFRPDGKAQRTFRPLWQRNFRYIQLEIKTKDQPLEIISIQNEYSGYPYPNMSTFECDQPKLNSIFNMSLRTFKLCSGETYYDTPFYEQLCYGGDNRPIGAISFYNSTDDRLYREMMRLYPQSENPKTGLFKSAYPSRFDFDMGTWSLAWVQSLDDYYTMRGDSTFVKQFVGNIDQVLGYFHSHIVESSMLLEHLQTKNFVDWSAKSGSVPHKDCNDEFHQSVLLTLYFAYTLDCCVDLYTKIGEQGKAIRWKVLSSKIKKAIYVKYWDTNNGLIREYPDKNEYTQHTNILAILCDVVPIEKQKELLNRILNYDKFDEKVSSYFSFFLFKAMQKTNQEDLILSNLNFWNNFINKGLTTCGESGFASMDRSDCHAWSAHPAYFLLNSICGIKPADIGFNNVLIEPNLGSLNYIKASMPHPKGTISVEYIKKSGKINANIFLPKGLNGEWNYQGQRIMLHEGQNQITNSIIHFSSLR